MVFGKAFLCKYAPDICQKVFIGIILTLSQLTNFRCRRINNLEWYVYLKLLVLGKVRENKKGCSKHTMSVASLQSSQPLRFNSSLPQNYELCFLCPKPKTVTSFSNFLVSILVFSTSPSRSLPLWPLPVLLHLSQSTPVFPPAFSGNTENTTINFGITTRRRMFTTVGTPILPVRS